MSDTIFLSSPSHPSPAIASADQVTVLGEGTWDDPLRSANRVQFSAAFAPPDPGDPTLGTPVAANAEPHGASLAASVEPAGADEEQDPHVAGIVVQIGGEDGDPVVAVQTAGIVTLPASAWDAVADSTGGLTSGAAYYLSASTLGHLTEIPPIAGSAVRVQVGVALNATSLLLSADRGPRGNGG